MNSSNDAARDAVGPVIALENQGQPARALRVVDALLAAAEPSPELLAAKARVLSDLGRHVDALAAADFAADMWPGSPTAHAARAEALESADRHHEALAAAERAIAMDALNVAAMRARAQALAATHSVAEALRWARHAADLASDDTLSVVTLIMVMLEADPEAAHREADAYVTRHRDPLALALRSAVRLSLDDADGALADAREATILDPENEAAALSALSVELAQERWDDAIIRAEVPALRNHVTAQFGAAVAYVETGRVGEALTRLSATLEQQPQNLAALTLLRITQMRLAKWGDLTLTCARILVLSPDDADTLIFRARAWCETDQPAAAVKDADQILARDPGNQSAINIRAFANILLDNPQQALADADAAIAAGAGLDTLAFQARMIALVALGRRREAESTARQVLRDDPDDQIARHIKQAADERWQGWKDTAATLAKTALDLFGT